MCVHTGARARLTYDVARRIRLDEDEDDDDDGNDDDEDGDGICAHTNGRFYSEEYRVLQLVGLTVVTLITLLASDVPKT